MNKMDLIAAVAETADLTKAKATEAVDAVFAAIEGALKANDEVRLVGFGSFSTSTRKATTGRNPQTGEPLTITERRVLTFKPSQILKSELNPHEDGAHDEHGADEVDALDDDLDAAHDRDSGFGIAAPVQSTPVVVPARSGRGDARHARR